MKIGLFCTYPPNALRSHLSCVVNSQATLTQPESVSVAQGQTTKLSCSKSSGSWSSYVHWYQQRSGQAPRFVHCNGCSNRGEGIPDRFTASASGNTGYLTVTNVQPEDEANYYCSSCASWFGESTENGPSSWFFLSFPSSEGVSSQATITQLASQSASPGETAKLSCTRNGGGSWVDFHWYQQKAGQVPRYVHRVGKDRGEGIPDRFTASQSGDTGYLTITNIQAEDDGDYYCTAWYGPSSVLHSDRS
ncbi:hypothetical protein JD844_015172 [Phrynosoma platyrhinos]|uniref:Ig-like domain-containing protein n=1 Tax=Phrynosoma platyrhinos TaxID=52577 RepID=A0ABQ7T7A3_PHRPL|nr:hypothetical protein JD844_015172 [Phrynosoma platyrhinos]